MMVKRFADRYAAGRELADTLQTYANRDDVVVLGLPRGGLPVAYEVAVRLNVPLDVFVVRKLGAPGHEEMAIGAIASGDVRVLNEDIVAYLDIAQDTIDSIEDRERRELRRRESLYRDDYPMPKLRDRTVLLVDDGLATGATMRAAVQALKQHQPAEIVVAVPTASRQTCENFRSIPEVDEIICLLSPTQFRAVGRWYEKFEQTSDEQVRILLQKARERDNIPEAHNQ